jgi:DNA-binding response OmpR family regulator
MRILVVEDYEPLRKNVVEYLREEGYVVDSSRTGDEGLWYAREHHFDVIVLDIMLPNIDGLIILKELRKIGRDTPIIITSALDATAQRIESLDAGADDYMVKPFSLPELVARIRVQTRKRYQMQINQVVIEDIHIDLCSKRVFRGEEEIILTRREYGLLEYLAFRKGAVVSRQEIWNHVYEDSEGGSSNAVDVYIGYLRKKLNSGGRDNVIHTRRGQGYYLEQYEIGK